MQQSVYTGSNSTSTLPLLLGSTSARKQAYTFGQVDIGGRTNFSISLSFQMFDNITDTFYMFQLRSICVTASDMN